ncbi:Mediator of RNA polymerase II transcription subunit 6 [Bienertia sinuspersici]
MATTPNPNLDGNQPPLPPPPGTDMTGICFRDQLWLNTYPLDRNLVFDYFALSPFYDRTCNNEQLRMNSIHPLDSSHLSKMTGIEYTLNEVIEPNLFVIREQKRDSPEKVTPMLTYYVLDGSIYQAPQLCNIFAARIGRALNYIQKAFSTASSKLEKIGNDEEKNDANDDSTASKETIDLREVKRVDHILASLQRKLQPAPPPPPFPDGYTPSQPTDAEQGSETQQGTEEQQLPPVDPIIDQGPAKRTKYD